MRFRAKFDLSSGATRIWIFLAAAFTAQALDRFLHRYHTSFGPFGFLDCLNALLALLVVYGQRSALWELDADGLRQRKLWRNIKVRWQDVSRIVNLWSSTYDLRIDYHLGQKIRSIQANPADREEFLAAVRRFAPQAEFVDESSTKILSL